MRVVIYSNDHRPAHVHVIGAGKEAVFELNCPPGPVVLRENYGFSRGGNHRDPDRAEQAGYYALPKMEGIHGER